jgi:putative SOS response-associated peptidase YedK
MPVVIAPEAFDAWLDCRNVDAEVAATLLTPAPDDFFRAYEVSPAVNHVANDAAEVLTPASELPPPPVEPVRARSRDKRDTGQGSLF